jgi:hypothetical protein
MYCLASGDPHYTIFSGYEHHFQGIGEYVFTQSFDRSFSVRTCMQRYYPGAIVATHRSIGIKTSDNVYTVDSGCNVKKQLKNLQDDHTISKSGNLVSMTFSGGEKVNVRCYAGSGQYGSHQTLQVWLPSDKYCNQVEGLCGAYSPGQKLANTYTTGDGALVQGWGGWGDLPRFQRDFGETFKVDAAHSTTDQVFDHGNCQALPPPAVAPKPFDGCLALKEWANANCCAGNSFDSCVDDIGQTCDKGNYAEENCALNEEEKKDNEGVDVIVIDAPPALPTPAPTPAPRVFLDVVFSYDGDANALATAVLEILRGSFGAPKILSVAPVQNGDRRLGGGSAKLRITAVGCSEEELKDFVNGALAGLLAKKGFIVTIGVAVTPPTAAPTSYPTPRPVDCQYKYVKVGTCTKTCGSGQQLFNRQITRPANFGGKCGAAQTKLEDCNTFACAVDCVVSGFSAYSPCTKSCGTGSKTRARSVITDVRNGGVACPALSSASPCSTKRCPIDCKVSGWSAFLGCSEKCNGGFNKKTRSIVTQPQFGGAGCAALEYTDMCNTHPCPVICVYEFLPWGACSASCGGGFQTSEVAVSRYDAHGGTACPDAKARACNTHVCPTPSPTPSPTPAPTPPPTPASSCPVITLKGLPKITIEASKDVIYSDAGAKCLDSVWGDISDSLKITSPVNRGALGTYSIAYNCENPAPWKCRAPTVIRTVEVRDTLAPVCTVKGKSIITTEASFTFTDDGATCVDQLDGAVAPVTTGTVNIEVAGTYKLTYTATDSSNNVAQKIRTVVVADTLKPVIGLNYGGKFFHKGDGSDTGANGEANPAKTYFKFMAEQSQSAQGWTIAAVSASIAGLAFVVYSRRSGNGAEQLSTIV